MITLITTEMIFFNWELVSIQNHIPVIAPGFCTCRSRREWAVRQYFQLVISQVIILCIHSNFLLILQVQSLYLQHIRPLQVIVSKYRTSYYLMGTSTVESGEWGKSCIFPMQIVGESTDPFDFALLLTWSEGIEDFWKMLEIKLRWSRWLREMCVYRWERDVISC